MLFAIWRKIRKTYLKNPKDKKTILVFGTATEADNYIKQTYKKPEYFKVVPYVQRRK